MKDIRILSQHFNNPDDISPWIFIPDENIREISTKENPGLVTVWQNGKGQDIKGVLKHPIGIGDYPMPWAFELSLIQNYYAAYFGAGDTKQANNAIGLNIALTFSDPLTWPEDRTTQPPETHSFQLFVVHLGATGEWCDGLPQFAKDRLPESFFIHGRGDLDEKLAADWNIPYIFAENMPHNGSASPQIFFRSEIIDTETIKIGIKFDEKRDFEMKTIKCSKYGKITGIWEIGPIFSCDRWIPDVLCKQIPLTNHIENPPQPVPPNPIHEFYVDYCTFDYCYPVKPLEHYSDDFEITGYLGKWRGFQIPFSAETWSNPGYLTITLLGASQGIYFGGKDLENIDLIYHRPPWEIEICFIAPDDSIPWDLGFLHRIYDERNKWVSSWKPGVVNSPKDGRVYFSNDFIQNPFFLYGDHFMENCVPESEKGNVIKLKSPIDLKFDVPKEVLLHKPLVMMYQMIDDTNVRIGFKAGDDKKWYFSEIVNFSKLAGERISRIGEICWTITSGRGFGMSGTPMYQKYLIKYVHYRYGITE